MVFGIIRNAVRLPSEQAFSFAGIPTSAAEAEGLPVLHVAPESAVGEAIAAAVSRIGRAAGPPWSADQRHAAAAALVALGSHLGELGAVRLT